MDVSGGKRKEYLCYAMYALAGAVAFIPLGGNYILSGGMITEWIARMGELAEGMGEGHLYLFPSADAIIRGGVRFNGLNSNLWFLLPGLLYRLCGNLVLVYRLHMAAVQLGTLFASILFFRKVFSKDGLLPSALGVLLYMTCPYRIYICYDFSNLSQAVAWMLLPLYLWAVLGLMGSAGKEGGGRMVVAALALAGIGYADGVFFVVSAAMSLLAGLIGRRPWVLAALAAGSVFYGPGLSRLLRYLFVEDFAEYGLPLKSIMPEGYRLGEYFSSYCFRAGHPGMGLGMLIGILAGVWLMVVADKKPDNPMGKIFAGLAGFFTVLSLRYFPWDLVERLGGWALKFVSLMDTPAMFWGMAFLCLCVPAAVSVGRIVRMGNKPAAYGVLLAVVLFCAGICVYQCNTLMYTRPPVAF